MKPTITNYARSINQGKSFNFATWDPNERYTNSDVKQDFVVDDAYNIYVCKQSVSIPGTAPKNDTAHWDLVLKSDKGFEQWSDSDKELLINSFLEKTNASEAVDNAKAVAENPPKVGANGNWWYWSLEDGRYVDSNKSSKGLFIESLGVTREVGELPGYLNENGTYVSKTDIIYDDEGNELKGIGTSQRMDINLSDGSTKRFFIPDGLSITGIRQTHVATESGEDNIFTVTYNNGARSLLKVRNGMDGMAFKKVESLPIGQPFETGYSALNLPNSRYLYLMASAAFLKDADGNVIYEEIATGTEITAVSGKYYKDNDPTKEEIRPWDDETNYSPKVDADADTVFKEYLWVEDAIYTDADGNVRYTDGNGNYSKVQDATFNTVVRGAYDEIGAAQVSMDDYVSYTEDQKKSANYKYQARKNIDAVGAPATPIKVKVIAGTKNFMAITGTTVSSIEEWLSGAVQGIKYIDLANSIEEDYYASDYYQLRGDDKYYFRYIVNGKSLVLTVDATAGTASAAWKEDNLPYVHYDNDDQMTYLTSDQKENARNNIAAEFIKNRDTYEDFEHADNETVVAAPISALSDDGHYPSSKNVFHFVADPKYIDITYLSATDTVTFTEPTESIARNFVAAPIKALDIKDTSGAILDAVLPEYISINRNAADDADVYSYIFHSLLPDLDRYFEIKFTIPDDGSATAYAASGEIKSNVYIRSDYDQSDYLELDEKSTARHNINATPLYNEYWKVKVENDVVTSVTEPSDILAWFESPAKILSVKEGTAADVICNIHETILPAEFKDTAEYIVSFEYNDDIITVTGTLNADKEVESIGWNIVSNYKKLYINTTLVNNATADPVGTKYHQEKDPVIVAPTVATRKDAATITDWLSAEKKALILNGTDTFTISGFDGSYEALISEGSDTDGHVWKWILNVAKDGTLSIIDATHEVKVTEQIFDDAEQAIARKNINAAPMYAKKYPSIVINADDSVEFKTPYLTPEEWLLWGQSVNRRASIEIGGIPALYMVDALNIPDTFVDSTTDEYKYEAITDDYRVYISFNIDSNKVANEDVSATRRLSKLLISYEEGTDKYHEPENISISTVTGFDNYNTWKNAEIKELYYTKDDTVNPIVFVGTDGKPSTKSINFDEGIDGAYNAILLESAEGFAPAYRWLLNITNEGFVGYIDDEKCVHYKEQTLDAEEQQIARTNINAAARYAGEMYELSYDETATVPTNVTKEPTNKKQWFESVNHPVKITIGGTDYIVYLDEILYPTEEGGTFKFQKEFDNYTVIYSGGAAPIVTFWKVESNTLEITTTTGTDKYNAETNATVISTLTAEDWLKIPAANRVLKVNGTVVPTYVDENNEVYAVISEGAKADGTNEYKWKLNLSSADLAITDATHFVKYTEQNLDAEEQQIARDNIDAAPLYAEYWEIDATDKANLISNAPTDISAWIGSEHRQVKLTDGTEVTVHNVETLEFPILNDPDPKYKFTFKEGDYRYTLPIENNAGAWVINNVSGKIFITFKKNGDDCETPLVCFEHSWSKTNGYMESYTGTTYNLYRPPVNDDITSPASRTEFNDWKDLENKYIYVRIVDKDFDNIHGGFAEADYTNTEFTYDAASESYIIPLYEVASDYINLEWFAKVNNNGEVIIYTDNTAVQYIEQYIPDSNKAIVAKNAWLTPSTTKKQPLIELNINDYLTSFGKSYTLNGKDYTMSNDEFNAWLSSNDRTVTIKNANGTLSYTNINVTKAYRDSSSYNFYIEGTLELKHQFLTVTLSTNRFEYIIRPKKITMAITGTEGTDVYKTPTNLNGTYTTVVPGFYPNFSYWKTAHTPIITYNGAEKPFEQIENGAYKAIISEGTNVVDGVTYTYKWAVVISNIGQLTLVDEITRLPLSDYENQYLASVANNKGATWKNYFQNTNPDAMRWISGDIFQYIGENDKVSTTDANDPKITFKPGGIYRVSFTSTEVTVIENTAITPATGAYSWNVVDSKMYKYNGTNWEEEPYGYRKDNKFYLKDPTSVTYDVLFERDMIPDSNGAVDEVLMGTANNRMNEWGRYILKKLDTPDNDAAGKPYRATYALFARHTAADGTTTDTEVTGATHINLEMDKVFKSGSIIVADGTEAAADGTSYNLEADKKYLKMIVDNEDEPVYIALSDVVDIYTAKTAEADDTIEVIIDANNVVSASIIDSSIKRAKFNAEVTDELDYIGYDPNNENLKTNVKDNLTNAINEIHDEIGDTILATDNKIITDAINELLTKMGELTDLTTTEKTNLVAAINEVNNKSSMIWMDTLDITGKTTMNDIEPFVSSGCKKGFVYDIEIRGDAAVTIAGVTYNNGDWVICYQDSDPAIEPYFKKLGSSVTYTTSGGTSDDGDFIIFD